MSGPATYSFGADATRYGSDLSGQNSAYFLQQSGGTAVVPADLLVKGDLQVNGTSALVGALTVGTTSVAVPTTLNGSLGVLGASNFNGGAQVGSGLTVGGGLSVVSGNLVVGSSGVASAPDFNGTNSVDGYRANFTKGLAARGIAIGGPGSGDSTLLVGSTVSPGGNIVGYNGASATLPVNFPFGAAMGAAISEYPITSGGDASYPYYFISIGKLRIAWGASAGSGGCQFPFGTTLPFNFATSTFCYASLNSGVGQPKRYICNVAGTAPNYFSSALLDSQTQSTPSENVGFNCIMVGAVA
jgi:hypothetical protein